MDTKTVIRLIKSLKVIFKVRIALCMITRFTANYITLLYTSFVDEWIWYSGGSSLFRSVVHSVMIVTPAPNVCVALNIFDFTDINGASIVNGVHGW